ncbi:hypothetical protein [Desulfobacter latus]|uniref:Uncharacterized protein n=1 Tax=Desulfobacter latus TaxID=2292 RepID=A0A850T0M9_9BACT|nr:hypothetical protein [Desulfobacter latus]NWH05253.1 hypothetical protein [Desulfobacter latus]
MLLFKAGWDKLSDGVKFLIDKQMIRIIDIIIERSALFLTPVEINMKNARGGDATPYSDRSL